MQTKRRLKPSVIKYIYKILIVVIITLILLIILKSSNNFKSQFYKYVYDTSFNFSDVINFYNKNFGSVYQTSETQTVSSENLTYSKISKYKDGAKLDVEDNYTIPVQESGVVVFIGDKEDYGKVVIVQQINGIDMWYGNVDDVAVSLYDYVTKGSTLGTCAKNLYVVYKQNGDILPYEKNI